MTRLLTAALCLTLAGACSSAPPAPPAPAPAPKLKVSGLELSAFDKAIRPQDDLFKHVNGTWLTKTEIPSDKASYGSFDMLFDKAQADLKAIVEAASKAPNKAPGSDAQKIGDFYDSFMNEARAEALGLTPLKDELAAIDAIKTKTDLAKAFAHFFKLNLISPLVGYVEGDARNPKENILYVYQGGIGLPDRDYYFKPDPKLKEYREKYVAFVASLLKMAGDEAADKSAKDIFDLETRIAKAHWTNVENRNTIKTYNKVAVADLPRQFPGFDWATWTAELGVNSVPNLIVSQPTYVKALAAAINELPVERWKPYLKASLLNGFAPYLSKPWVDAEFGFYRATLEGVKDQQPRWKRAVNNLNGNLGEMLGKLYVDKHFTPEAKASITKLVANLRETYKTSLDSLEWMAPETKKKALEKLAKFTPKVGYPNKWRDYSKLEIKKDDLVGNMSRAFMNENNFQLGKTGKPVDPEEWGMTPQTINAYYNPVRNEIVFPAAILQPPFFNPDADDAVNYGAIGGVIGHEMGHAFDDQGRQYDADGALRDWWTKEDAAKYEKQTKMLVEQFNQFEALPGLKVNGALTLGENIADLTGLTIAHRAYQLTLGGKPGPEMDGLKADQRFYMGWAQAWRSKMRDDAMRQQVMSNVHAPDMFRANGPLRNVPDFYAAFGVNEGDKLFLPPDKRIKIW